MTTASVLVALQAMTERFKMSLLTETVPTQLQQLQPQQILARHRIANTGALMGRGWQRTHALPIPSHHPTVVNLAEVVPVPQKIYMSPTPVMKEEV